MTGINALADAARRLTAAHASRCGARNELLYLDSLRREVANDPGPDTTALAAIRVTSAMSGLQLSLGRDVGLPAGGVGCLASANDNACAPHDPMAAALIDLPALDSLVSSLSLMHLLGAHEALPPAVRVFTVRAEGVARRIASIARGHAASEPLRHAAEEVTIALSAALAELDAASRAAEANKRGLHESHLLAQIALDWPDDLPRANDTE